MSSLHAVRFLLRRLGTRSATLVCAAACLGVPAGARAADATLAHGPFSSEALESLAGAGHSLPDGFTDTTVFTGLDAPTTMRWAADGRVFVAQQNGVVEVFDGPGDTTPTPYVDLRGSVYQFADKGLLGLALDPAFTTGRPYVYVLYTYDKDPNSSLVPRWNDDCPDPPGADGDGCVDSARLSRIDPDGTEHVLVEDWCGQYSSHTIGALNFGSDGALYASAGDGASYLFADYGQGGSPVNPCGDPPGDVGGAMDPPSAQGGALRAQSFRRAADQPVSLDGTIIRVDPDTGAALPDNPAAGDANANRRRIVAYGMRNPFRFTLRPGTDELWFGDVGWNQFEEINRVPDVSAVRDYGWPCYEGDGHMGAYDTLNLSQCESLYSAGTTTAPYFAYDHGENLAGDAGCPAGTSSTTGLAFYTGAQFPAAYHGALFAADFARGCIFVLRKGADGLPDPDTAQVFEGGSDGPVDLQQGPDGALYYVDLVGGSIHKIAFPSGNNAPTAAATATPDHGPTPLTVSFDGSGSSDPDGGELTYAWDLDGDGTFDDATSATASHVYATAGNYLAQLRVTDSDGASDVLSLPITAGDTPEPTIGSPAESFTWATGDTIAFSGSAVDGHGDPLPASALSWKLNIRHCSRVNASSCHTHSNAAVNGVASGSFVAPDHDYPSHLELVLTATDADGLSASKTIRLDPKTVELTLDSRPAGAQLSAGADTGTAPFTHTFIQNSTTTITAATPQAIGGIPYAFSSWSDGGAGTHTITVPRTDTTYTAAFARVTELNLAGADVVGGNVSQAAPGHGEVYRTTATTTGTATKLRLYVDAGSTTDRLALGLYADDADQPGTLLGQAATTSVTAGTWNEVTLPSGIAVTAGSSYWIGLLNPSDGAGTLKWRDHAGGGGGAEQTSASSPLLAALPATWATGGEYSDGPVSGYVFGAPADPSPAPVQSVSPSSLAFSAVAGGSSPAAKTLAVTNAGTGTLSFSASDDADWLSVSPTGGSAPDDVTVTVDTTGLEPGTYTAGVTIDGGAVSGSPTTIPVTLTVTPAPEPGETLLGFDAIGLNHSSAPAGAGEAYRLTATATGVATRLRLYVDDSTTADALVLGLYADGSGEPTSLLGAGRLDGLTTGAWNEVTLASGVALTAGTEYWFGLLNPTGSGGTLAWRDHAGGLSGGPENTSAGRTMSELPALWSSLGSYFDGPVSGYAVSSGPPAPAVLSVSPSSLSFSATEGEGSPAAKTLTVSNSGGGTLDFTASADAPWLSTTPASGTAPQAVTVAADTSGLTAGTYTGHVTIDGGSISGSPETIAVTLTVTGPTPTPTPTETPTETPTPSPPVLVVTPGSLSFAATEGGPAPASQGLSVTEAGAAMLSYTASSDAPWLSAAPASGATPATVDVSVDPAGLTAGTYTGAVTVSGAGAVGSLQRLTVSFTLSPPVAGATVSPPPVDAAVSPPAVGGLVGAWGFDETAGTTAADSSGKGNAGAIAGAARTTSGRFGGALTFNGTSSWVTVANSPSLRLTTGMTLEGWAYPTANGRAAWRAMMIKETATGLAWALYPFGDGGRPGGHAFTSGEQWAGASAAPALNAWTHLAVTYDGNLIRLYVNGTLLATKAQTGSLATSSQPLRFGGDSLWPEWFKGRLDELRVYDRPLAAPEIQADMKRPVSSAALLRAQAKLKRAGRPSAAKQRRAVSKGVRITRYRAKRPHAAKARAGN
jgi:glucose/arabinose dehydrogenase/PKD repeat protein